MKKKFFIFVFVLFILSGCLTIDSLKNKYNYLIKKTETIEKTETETEKIEKETETETETETEKK